MTEDLLLILFSGEMAAQGTEPHTSDSFSSDDEDSDDTDNSDDEDRVLETTDNEK